VTQDVEFEPRHKKGRIRGVRALVRITSGALLPFSVNKLDKGFYLIRRPRTGRDRSDKAAIGGHCRALLRFPALVRRLPGLLAGDDPFYRRRVAVVRQRLRRPPLVQEDRSRLFEAILAAGAFRQVLRASAEFTTLAALLVASESRYFTRCLFWRSRVSRRTAALHETRSTPFAWSAKCENCQREPRAFIYCRN